MPGPIALVLLPRRPTGVPKVLIRRSGALIAAQSPKNKETVLGGIAARGLLRAAGAGWCRGRARTAGRGCRTAKPRLQGSDPSPERFIFLAGEPRHTLNGLEFLSMDARELAENPLRLGAEQCLGLAPHALRYPRRIVHQSRNFVEEPVRGLDHVRLRKEFASAASERFRLSLAIPLHNGNGGAPSQGVRRRIRLRGPGRDPLTRLELL